MNIRVDLEMPIRDGTEVVFRSPVDCSQVTGLIVYYKENGNTTSTEFAFADAHGNNVGDIDHLFAENVVVKVILDVTTGMAFVQNADTNAYLEGRFDDIINKLAPSFTESGTAVRCEPVEGYPLTVTAEEGAATISRCGKNLIDYKAVIPGKNSTITIIENGVRWESGNYFFSFPCTVKAGETVVFNCVDPSSSMYYAALWNTELSKNVGTQNKIGEPFTATGDADLVHIYKKNSSTALVEPIVVTDLQLEHGSVATAYESYKGVETFVPGETIPAWSGVNTLWADVGEITVTGKADPVAIIEKLSNAILALGGNV